MSESFRDPLASTFPEWSRLQEMLLWRAWRLTLLHLLFVPGVCLTAESALQPQRLLFNHVVQKKVLEKKRLGKEGKKVGEVAHICHLSNSQSRAGGLEGKVIPDF